MEKITFAELSKTFREFNSKHNNGEGSEHISGVIVYKQENFDTPFSEIERSYRVCSNQRKWQSGKIATSYSGDCLDGIDLGVRLDWYNWAIDYCYLD